MQRRVEQADRDRQAVHRLEDALEVLLLQRQQLVERGAPRSSSVVREDHLAHLRLAVGAMNMCSVRHRPMPCGAELARLARVLGRVGVRAHAEPAQLVGPREHALEVLGHLGLDERDVVDGDRAGRAVDRDAVALAQRPCPRRAPRRAARSISSALAPVTAGRPMPRATSAAWLGLAALAR